MVRTKPSRTTIEAQAAMCGTALSQLRLALRTLRRAGAPGAADAVARACKSVEGAARHRRLLLRQPEESARIIATAPAAPVPDPVPLEHADVVPRPTLPYMPRDGLEEIRLAFGESADL